MSDAPITARPNESTPPNWSFDETRSDVDLLVSALPNLDLVTRFVAIFSRLEYALKTTTCYRHGDRSGVYANWDKFANDLVNLRNCKEERITAAIELFDNDPPKKQVIKNGKLALQAPIDPNGDNAALFVRVRCIRNNLFHGVKFPWDPNRDTKLLEAAETLMIAGLSLHPKVREAFREQPMQATV